jgi:shikimate kinase
MNPADVNLYLVGFMGTGKTTVGRAVGAKLGFQVLDSDHEIERARGKSIPDIFAQDGEPAFRQLEREFIERGHPAERTVIACGGGLVV